MKHEAQALPLFHEDRQRPLADRLRPRTLKDVVGQEHLLAPDAPVGRMVEQGRLCGGHPVATQEEPQPRRLWRGLQTLIRADSGGGTHEFVAWLAQRGRWLSYSVSMTITGAIHPASA